MDMIDYAAEREQADRERALADHRAAQRDALPSSFCLDCGDDIPPARQYAVPGVTTCVDCQTLLERNGSRHA